MHLPFEILPFERRIAVINPDLPIKKESEDLLNRTQFAENLALAIKKFNAQSSFSIGLYGPWGSGKTSLLNLALGKLEEIDNEIVILRFNPWLCSDPQQLISQYFAQLAAAIKLKREAAGQAVDLIGQFGELFKLASFVPKYGGLIAGAGSVMVGAAKLHREPNLQKKKDEIIKKLKEEKLKIVVAIDDIDRLSEEETVAVFQLVKALADFPNTVYLLAFDREVVVQALEKVQSGKGEAYLEKVVQVPFEIPSPNMTSIHNAFFSKLDETLGDIPEEKWDPAMWRELFHYGFRNYVQSLRDVVRFVNVFSLKYELLEEETDPIDLLGITCLQVFEPSVYSTLAHHKETVCGASSIFSSEAERQRNEQIKNSIEEMLETAKNKTAAQRILGILFPHVNTALGQYSSGRTYNSRGYIVHKNVAASECFDRYFSLTLEDNAIPTSQINHIVRTANEDECENSILRIYLRGKLPRLLDELQGLTENGSPTKIPDDRAQLLIVTLSRLWHTFDVEDNLFFSIPPDIKYDVLVMSLLRGMASEAKKECIQSVFQDERVHLKTLTLLLDDLQAQHGRFSKREPTSGVVLGIEDVLSLEEVFKKRAIEKLDHWSDNPSYDLFFLWKLEQMEPELVSEKKKKLIQDDASLLSVIRYCTSHGKRASRIGERTWKVDLDGFAKFANVEKTRKHIEEMANSEAFASLPKASQEDAVAFLLAQQPLEEEDRDGHIPAHVIENKLNEILGKR